MNIQFTLAARYLVGRKLRTTLTTLAVVFGVLVLFGMNALLPTLIQAFQANLLAASGQVDVTVTHKTNAAFLPTAVEKVRMIENVRAASGYLDRPLNLPLDFVDHDPAQPDAVTTLSLVGLDVDSIREIRSYAIDQGRFLQTGDEAAAVITTSLADVFGVKLGDTIKLPTAKGEVGLTIVGLRPARAIPGNEEVLVTLPEAQALLDQPNLINTIDVALTTLDEAERTAAENAILAALGENFRLSGLTAGNELFNSLKIGQAVMSVFGFLALVMGGFIIFNTFRTVVAERRRDIGMLRAIGAKRRTIIGIVLAEGLLQGIIGTAIGMALGYLMSAGLLALVGDFYEQFVHIRPGPPVITPMLVVITIMLGIGTTVFAGLLPAFSASRVSPLEALRPSSPETQLRAAGWGALIGAVLIVLAALGLASGNTSLAGLGGIMFLCGLILLAPALVRPIASVFGRLYAVLFAREGTGTLAQGNLTRQPTRAAITASSTMIGLAVIVATGGLITSVSGTFLDRLRKSLGSDYLFIPPSIAVWSSDVGADETLADKLREVEGVGVVSTMRFAPSSTTAGAAPTSTASGDVPISLLGIDPVAYPQVASLGFDSGEPQVVYAELNTGRTLIANGILAANAHVKVGDSLKLVTPDGTQEYKVIAIAGDYLNAKVVTGYISQANLANDFHVTEDIFIQLNLAPGADRAVVEPRIKAVADTYPQFRLISGEAYYEENAKIFSQVFVSLYVLFGVLALPSLISILNTLAIGVIERTREIGMLRAVGATQKQVRRMVLAEAVLLATTGTVFGLLAGVYLSYMMIGAMSAAGYPMSFSFPYYGIVSALAVGLLFGVVAALIPARQAARLEIVQALRYE